MDAADVILRAYDPERDIGFIYSTWRRSLFYGLPGNSKTERMDPFFFSEQTEKIKRILHKAEIRIACLKEHPVVIIGYSVSTGTHLDWIYVKESYRDAKVATLLFPKEIETVTEDSTPAGRAIVKKKNLKTKGESNGDPRRDEGKRLEECSSQTGIICEPEPSSGAHLHGHSMP